MSCNILEEVRLSLNYPALKKIDPNTQDVQVTKAGETADDKFGQAAIPAVLTGLYTFVQTDEGAAEFLAADNTGNWVEKIFHEHKDQVVKRIASYASVPGTVAARGMNVIAKESIKKIKEHLHSATAKDVKQFFHDQLNTILSYLPAEIHTGELLHNTVLDDNTNKMKGPISSLIQGIGAAFSNPVSDKEL